MIVQKYSPALLSLPTSWHRLYRIDPLLSLVARRCLEEVVSLIGGDDLKEVAIDVVLFGWMEERVARREMRTPAADGIIVFPEGGKRGACVSCDNSPSGTNSTAVTTEPRRWMEPRGSSLWQTGSKIESSQSEEIKLLQLKKKMFKKRWAFFSLAHDCQYLPLWGHNNAYKQGRPSVWTCAPSSFFSCVPATADVLSDFYLTF